MNVSSISSNSFLSPLTAVQANAGTSPAARTDADGDGDGGRVRHGGGHHGGMRNALMQALSSLGLSVPSTSTTQGANASGANAGSGTDSDGDNDGSGATSASGNLKHDMRQFMHELFQAVRSEAPTGGAASNDSASTGAVAPATGSASQSAANSRADFSNSLSALITQVGNGSAPSGLQSAFDALMADLGTGTGTNAGAASSTPVVSNTTTTIGTSLQQLLTALQQNLGYGAATGSSSVGNTVNAAA